MAMLCRKLPSNIFHAVFNLIPTNLNINLWFENEVLVINRAESVAPIEEVAQRPSVLQFSRAQKGGIKIVFLGIVKAVLEKTWHRLGGLVGDKDEDMHCHPPVFVAEVNLDVLPGGTALHEPRVRPGDLEFDPEGG